MLVWSPGGEAGEEQVTVPAQALAEAQALGPTRAEAIRAYLVDRAGLDASRVTVSPDTAQAEDSGDRVSCRLTLSVADG